MAETLTQNDQLTDEPSCARCGSSVNLNWQCLICGRIYCDDCPDAVHKFTLICNHTDCVSNRKNARTRYKTWLKQVDAWRDRHGLTRKQALNILDETLKNEANDNAALLADWDDVKVFLSVARDEWKD